MSSQKEVPNIFNFATSELSHDAFIAWLLSWSDPVYHNNSLNSFSFKVLKKFFEISDKKISDIKEVEVKTQWRNIDVLVIVTEETGNKWAIIIENKMYTSEHSDQLKRYREVVKEDDDLKSIPEKNVIGIYYKMLEQSNLHNVQHSRYSHFGRKLMLDLHKYYEKGSSQIVDAYYRYLNRLQKELDAFHEKKWTEWNHDQWVGFYSQLKKDLNVGDFGYVPNKSGGFMGYWLQGKRISDDSSIYLQVEEDKLCIKVRIEDISHRQHAKWFWNDAVIKAGEKAGVKIVKPSVMRVGRYFTIGVLKTDNKEPWMVTDKEKKIKYSETIQLFKKVSGIIETVSQMKPDYLSDNSSME